MNTSTMGANRKKRCKSMLTCMIGSGTAELSNKSLWLTPAAAIQK